MTEGYDDDQLKFRAQHGFLVWDAIRSGTKLIELRKRDGWITRLFASLTEPQQDAMVGIELAFRSITAGVGMKNFDPNRLPGSSYTANAERQHQLISDYFNWARSLQGTRISHAMAIAIIVEGRTANEVDRMYRIRKGKAMCNLREALDVFCVMQGWPTTKVK